MIRVAAVMGCMVVGGLLSGCDVQVSQGSSGANGRQPAGLRGGGPAFAFADVQKRAVGVQLKSQLIMARNACQIYEAENGQYPERLSAQGADEPAVAEVGRDQDPRDGSARRHRGRHRPEPGGLALQHDQRLGRGDVRGRTQRLSSSVVSRISAGAMLHPAAGG